MRPGGRDRHRHLPVSAGVAVADETARRSVAFHRDRAAARRFRSNPYRVPGAARIGAVVARHGRAPPVQARHAPDNEVADTCCVRCRTRRCLHMVPNDVRS